MTAEAILGNMPEINLAKYPGLDPAYQVTPAGWSCIARNQYDGPGSPMGWGTSRLDALQDLCEQLDAEAAK